MQLVRYTLCDIDLMMVDIEGTLYCSTPQLEKVFRCNRSQLMHVCNKWSRGDFGTATLGDLVMSNQQHKVSAIAEGLMLKRVQPKTRLWSEDDVLGFAFALRSDIARQCRAQFKEILKQHARREMVPREQLDKMMLTCSTLTEQVGYLWQAVEDLKEANRQMASNAGRSLRLVKS